MPEPLILDDELEEEMLEGLGDDELFPDDELDGLGITRAARARLKALARKAARRRRRGKRLPGREGISHPLWDSKEIATSGTTRLTFFQQTVGTATLGKVDTNMEQAGEISGGNAYDIHSIGVGLRDSAATPIPPAELREIMYTSYLELKVSNRIYFEALIPMLPFGGGPTGVDATVATTFTNFGVPDAKNRMILKRKIRLPKDVNFSVDISWSGAGPTPTAAIHMVVWFDGVLWRGRV